MDPKYVRFDWAMKRLLRDKANYAVLEGLITVLLGRKYTITKILESEGNQENENDKFNRVDLLAESEKGELIIVEIQNTRELTYFHRILYGTSKAITEYISLGDDYDKVRKVYSINIVYFDMGQGRDYVYHGKTVFRGLHDSNDILKLTQNQTQTFFGAKRVKEVGCEEAGAIFPEYYILRVNDFNSVAKTPIEEWMHFLKSGDIAQDTQTPGLKEALEKLKYDSLSAEEKAAYRRTVENSVFQKSVIQTSFNEGKVEGIKEGRIEGRVEGRIEGRIKGRDEGREEMQKQIIKTMIGNGFDDETIAKITSASVEEIKQLRE